MSSPGPQRIDRLRGRVSQGRYGTGSKSDRPAIFLATDDGRYQLRRKGGPAMDDPALQRLVGREVECDGFLVGTTLLAERIEVVKE